MPSAPRAVFLLLRRLADLERARDELADYGALLRRRAPAGAAERIRGIWIDEEAVANLPDALALPDAVGGTRRVRILETTGINGIWMLCWLDAAAHTVSRVDLVAALLECFGHDATGSAMPTAHFIPVYAGDAVDPSARADLRALNARYPGLLLPPAQVDSDGSLRLPAMPAAGGRPS